MAVAADLNMPDDQRTMAPSAIHQRSLASFGTLLRAEEKLLNCCRGGDMATLAKKRPVRPSLDNRIRASFVRFLVLGGDEAAQVHERGVRLRGGWLTGPLDLENANIKSYLKMIDCRIS